MSLFDRTEEEYIVDVVRQELMMPEIGIVKNVEEHTEIDDKSNFECDVLLRGETQQRRDALIATVANDTVRVPQEDDLALVQFLDGDGERPVVTHVIHTNDDRAPLGESGIIRENRGDLYYEAGPNGDFMRIGKKSNDDDSGLQADTVIEIDDSTGDGDVNIKTSSGATININASGGTVQVDGDTVELAGGGNAVARKGDSVEVSDPDSGTLTGTITGGSGSVNSG